MDVQKEQKSTFLTAFEQRERGWQLVWWICCRRCICKFACKCESCMS